MFSLYYTIKNIRDEIKSENTFDSQMSKLRKYDTKLRECIQKFTYKFYIANYDSGYQLNKFILLNLVHEIDYMNRQNKETLSGKVYCNTKNIRELIQKTKDKIKELKSEMKKL